MRASKMLVGMLLFVAVLYSVGFTKLGWDVPAENDTKYFLSLAENLSAGHGYVNGLSYWPEAKSADRAPGWPFLIAAGLKLFSGLNAAVLLRALSLILVLLNAGLFFRLANALDFRPAGALFTGLVYALHPVTFYLAWMGLSEAFFITLFLAGILFFMKKQFLSAGFIWGLSVLVRPAMLVGIVPWGFFLLSRGKMRMINKLLAVFLFLLPAGSWMLRNYQVLDTFPLLSSGMGRTLHGANNEVVATPGKQWGYWIHPNDIPGEQSGRVLAQELDEVGLHRYYVKQAIIFLKENPFKATVGIAGKWLHGFVPWPWAWSWQNAFTQGYRLCFLFVVLLGFKRFVAMAPDYLFIIALMFFVTLVTTTIFYGSARFSYPLEVALMPIIASKFSSLFSSTS